MNILNDKKIIVEKDDVKANDIYNNPSKYKILLEEVNNNVDYINNNLTIKDIKEEDIVFFEKGANVTQRDFKNNYPKALITNNIYLANIVLTKNGINHLFIPWSIRSKVYGNNGNNKLTAGDINLQIINNLLKYSSIIDNIIKNKMIILASSIKINNVLDNTLLTESEQDIILKYFNNGSNEFIHLALSLIYSKNIEVNKHILAMIISKCNTIWKINKITKGKRFLTLFKDEYPGLRI